MAAVFIGRLTAIFAFSSPFVKNKSKLTFSSISASVRRESEGTRWQSETIWRSERARLAACSWCVPVRVGRVEVRVGEAVIVSIMAWADDNGCPRQKSETRRGFHASLGRASPAPSDFSRSAVARLLGDRNGECEMGGRRVFPSPCEGRGSKVRVRIPRAIHFARDLRFCRLGTPVIGNGRAGAVPLARHCAS